MDEAIIQRYLDRKGCFCPFCGEDTLAPNGDYETDVVGRVLRRVVCETCGHEWKDVFILAGMKDADSD
jgi:C4-type Zn-finger protein